MIDCSQECEVYTDTGTDVMGNHGRSRGIGRRGPEEKSIGAAVKYRQPRDITLKRNCRIDKEGSSRMWKI